MPQPDLTPESDAAERPEPQPGDPTPAPAPDPAPAAVGRDEFQAFVAQNTQTLQTIAESMRVLATANAAGQRTVPPTIDDVSDEEINQAALQGNPIAPLIRRAAKAEAARETRELKARLEQLQQGHGVALQSLSAEVIAGKLPHYQRFAREIADRMAPLADNLKSDPNTIRQVYNMVVGAHAEELVAEAKEQAVRATREAPPAVARGGAATGRQVAAEGKLQPEDVFDAQTMRALRESGGPEAHAAKLGYKKDDGTGDVDAWMATVATYGGRQ